MFKRLNLNYIFKNHFSKAGLFFIGGVYYYYNRNIDHSAQFFFFNYNKNNYNNIQYSANKPIEDRVINEKLKNVNADLLAVLDGHGGWQLSEYTSKNLSKFIDEELSNSNINTLNDEKQKVDILQKALINSLSRIENNIIEAARDGYKFGSALLSRVGTCCLVCIKYNKKLIVANLGDSKGYWVSNIDNKVNMTKLNSTLNADNPKEQKRLKEEFPNDDQIYICKNKKKNKSCYVKGRLQCTYTLGDLYLKFNDLNNPNKINCSKSGFRNHIRNFDGPYINSNPQIRLFDLESHHKGIVLATDGLWDILSKNQVGEIIKNQNYNKNNIPRQLLETSLDKCSKYVGIPINKLKSVPLGERRKLHDDISIIYYEIN